MTLKDEVVWIRNVAWVGMFRNNEMQSSTVLRDANQVAVIPVEALRGWLKKRSALDLYLADDLLAELEGL